MRSIIAGIALVAGTLAPSIPYDRPMRQPCIWCLYQPWEAVIFHLDGTSETLTIRAE